ncbi:uncharacterized protein J8A68_002193 [[Candida] subhashii]|uniref:DUF676 domain-containing protein n=1 Tax=[Candida] subhashii TaxID=561895 RepID=A0A8J5UJ66_9ASCO|nr:uncharacterized protein J8A68_002193 [[Candida] subhashii]KAG7664278.1 hypothetical protein J8A68_002193 [[Candida] subhashii]
MNGNDQEDIQVPIVVTKDQLNRMEDRILYRQVKSVKAGQIERFKINFTPQLKDDEIMIPPTLWLKIKNVEPLSKRAIYLAGPYILYVDCRSSDYNQNDKCFITADQPVYEPQLLAGQSFYVQLSCHTLKEDYWWTVDVISQIIFNNAISIDFEIMIGTSKQILHESSFPERSIKNSDKIGVFNPLIHVDNWDTYDLWNLPVPDPDKPIHLVILTHGLHSNTSADMLYLKEQVDAVSSKDSNVVVKGFFGNTGKTERGIKYLGSRVAEYIIELVSENETFNNGKVDRISFIGHSLGGCIQTFTIAYLKVNFPWFFDKIKPENFITLASPLLGVVNENPVLVKLALSAGVVGKTGQELGLKIIENDSRPLLLLLPSGPTHMVLKQFKRRTLYANAINDGIVPLRTSCLLYLDYKALSQIMNTVDVCGPNGITTRVPKVNEVSPVQTFLSYLMPQKQKPSEGTYHRFQTKKGEGVEDEDGQGESVEEKDFTIDEIPNSTFFEAAPALLLPPLPPIKYIVDPGSRENVILHDKMYYEKDLPPRRQKNPNEPPTSLLQNTNNTGIDDSYSTTIKKKLMLETVDYAAFEEEIAREYHKKMSWRKVVVKLKPEAHNNIIVRRRFANAYGWPVIQHLVDNHFGPNAEIDQKKSIESADIPADSLDQDLGLSKVASRDYIAKQNIEIEETITEEHSWINSKDDSDSLFALGVTGLLGEVTERVGDIRDQINTYGLTQVNFPLIGLIRSPIEIVPPTNYQQQQQHLEPVVEEECDLGLTKSGIMGNFI